MTWDAWPHPPLSAPASGDARIAAVLRGRWALGDHPLGRAEGRSVRGAGTLALAASAGPVSCRCGGRKGPRPPISQVLTDPVAGPQRVHLAMIEMVFLPAGWNAGVQPGRARW